MDVYIGNKTYSSGFTRSSALLWVFGIGFKAGSGAFYGFVSEAKSNKTMSAIRQMTTVSVLEAKVVLPEKFLLFSMAR